MTAVATESGQDFAARFWGGTEVTPERSGVTYGPREIDGGRRTQPAGWAFRADGFSYRVWFDADSDRGFPVWQMEVGYDGFATFYRDRNDPNWWVIESYGDPRRELAR